MFKPLNNRVLIKPDEPVQETAFGILLPMNKEKAVTGEVIVGNKDLKKGDKVVFSKFGLDEVTIDNEIHYVVSDVNILGKF